MDNQLAQLAKRLNLTNSDSEKEPYILTPQDEEEIIQNEIVDLKKHYVWKCQQLALPEMDILIRMDKINWDEQIDKEEILQRANSARNYAIWLEEKRKKEEQQKKDTLKELNDRYTAKYVYNFLAWVSQNVYNKKLIVDDYNREYIKTICFFFSNDPRFETELKFSFQKGLMIRGISGLGKTYIPRCLQHNELKPISIFSMIDITDEVKRNGDYDIITDKIIYLDDVGTEEANVNHYGTKISWFKNYLELYYSKNLPFNKLIISTNCNSQQLEERYGFRVRSRMKDMFNVIDLTGQDMRG